MFDNFENTFILIFTDYKDLLLTGLKNTLLIAFGAFILGILLGAIVAIIKFLPQNNILVKILNKIGSFYVAIFRGTPIVVQLLLIYFGLLAPLKINKVLVAVLVFGLNSGAYVSEIMRAGISSIEKGQMEAGRSLGLSYGVTMFKIVIPQAIKNIIPTLTNELIALVKETSVAGYVTVMDITRVFQSITSSTYDVFTPYFVLACIYFVIVSILTFFLRFVERRLRKGDNR